MTMDDEAQARIDVLKYTNGFVEMRVVRCMIELGLPEILRNHGGPMTLSELSSAVGCPETVIYHIMRFLTHKGIFKKRLCPITGSDGPSLIYYTETPVSGLLALDNMGASVLIFAGSKETSLTPDNLKAGKGSCLRSYSTEDELWKMIDEAPLGLFRAYLASHAKGMHIISLMLGHIFLMSIPFARLWTTSWGRSWYKYGSNLVTFMLLVHVAGRLSRGCSLAGPIFLGKDGRCC